MLKSFLGVFFKLVLACGILLFFSCELYARKLEANFADLVVDKLKNSVKNIDAVAIDFVQTDLNNNKADGKLIINKPYKFRCNYYAPYPLLIIGNKNYISIYDYSLESLSRIESQGNILSFLLMDSDDFFRDFDVKLVNEVGNFYIVSMVSRSEQKDIDITFSKSTFDISEIKITDYDNVINVVFDAIKKIKDVDQKLFVLKNTDTYGAPARLGKADLEKMYKLDR